MGATHGIVSPVSLSAHLTMTNRKKLPLGIQTFSEIIEGGYYYVDKTMLVWQMIDQGKYYFLSRPRRFGKSLFLDTLKSAFEGRQDLFAGLAITRHTDLAQSWPVLHFNFAAGPQASPAALLQLLQRMLADYEQQFGLPGGAANDTPGQRLAQLLAHLHHKSGRKVVVLVDEYDKPILDHLLKPELATQMRDILREFYSTLKAEDEHLRFVFLTGVSKFSKAGLFSGLNHLHDITLDPRYATVCGYTETELRQVFADQIDRFDSGEIKRWYNGYHWLGEPVYNPWSILSLFATGRFKNYWFESGTPTFLINLLREKQVFIPRLAEWKIPESSLSEFEIGHIAVEALLFQTGYLSIRAVHEQDHKTWYTLGWPNLEVSSSLNESLLLAYTGQALSPDMSAILANSDWPALKGLLQARFAAIPHQWHTQNPMAHYEGWYASVFFSHFAALGLDVRGEDATSHGRVDLALLLPDKTCLFEFKVSAQGDNPAAMAQLREKRYAEKYRARGVPVWLIGVTFSHAERNIVGFMLEPDQPPAATLASAAVAFPSPEPHNPKHITLLHLTDLHFGFVGTETEIAQRKRCLDGLLAQLRSLQDDWRPDVVLISGDLGWTGADSDYQLASVWLNQLCQACAVDPARIVLAPGNHDSQRARTQRVPRPSDAADADIALQVPLFDIAQAKAFEPLAEFAASYGLPALQLGEESTRLAGVTELAGIRVLVLNSAWCARGDDDQAQLWLGLPQLQAMAAHGQIGLTESGAPLTVALIHHPFDWLHESETHAVENRPNTKDYLAARCHVLLTGHNHAEVRPAEQMAHGCWHFSAGTTYASGEHRNSFRLLQIEDEQCRYRTWEFAPRNAKHEWQERQYEALTLSHVGKVSPAPVAGPVAGAAPSVSNRHTML